MPNGWLEQILFGFFFGIGFSVAGLLINALLGAFRKQS